MTIELKPVPPLDAMAALRARGKVLSPSFAWQERYASDHAKAFTVAKSAGFDILGDLYTALDQALAEGRTARDFADQVTPILQAKGWWGKKPVINPATGVPDLAQLGSPQRLSLIFGANMRTAYAAGSWASFERNRRTRPYLRYVHLENQLDPRPEHHLWHNTTLPIDHPWWKTHACPNGWNCHCTLQSLSDADLKTIPGLKFEPPPEDLIPWTNKVTGETRLIDRGIDPGWDNNPGKDGYFAAVNDAFALRVATAPLRMVAAAVTERVSSDDFRRFIESPEGAMPVMAIGEALAAAIGTEARAAVLSADTMTKQAKNHPELLVGDYLSLPAMAETPTLVVQDSDKSIAIFQSAPGGKWRYAVIRATATGKAAFLTSFRYTSDRDVQRVLRRSRILVDNRGDKAREVGPVRNPT